MKSLSLQVSVGVVSARERGELSWAGCDVNCHYAFTMGLKPLWFNKFTVKFSEKLCFALQRMVGKISHKFQLHSHHRTVTFLCCGSISRHSLAFERDLYIWEL